MFAGVIFRVPVFFMGEDDADQLNEIITVLGGAKLFEYIEKYGIEVVDDGLYEKRGVPNIPFYELRDGIMRIWLEMKLWICWIKC